MDTSLTSIEKGAEEAAATVVSDVDAAIGRAEQWAAKLFAGSLETRVVGGFAGEILAGLKALRSEVAALAQRLGEPTAPPAP